jgi:GNAT superfamily N-acetyltransferase
MNPRSPGTLDSTAASADTEPGLPSAGSLADSFQFSTSDVPAVEEFADVLRRSTLADRRPIDDPDCLAQMVANANLWATCRKHGQLIAIARSVTDFAYCCYLSDLAVDQAHARKGIGRRMIEETRSRLGPRCSLILLSAPAAVDYYPHIGFTHHPQAWVIRPPANP